MGKKESTNRSKQRGQGTLEYAILALVISTTVVALQDPFSGAFDFLRFQLQVGISNLNASNTNTLSIPGVE